MPSLLELSIIVVVIVLVAVVVWRLFVNVKWYGDTKSKSLYMSSVAEVNTSQMNPLNLTNVTNGTSLELDCPSGYTVSIQSIFINSMPAPGEGGFDPSSNSSYSPQECWDSIANMGPGYPVSGTQTTDSTYVTALKNIKSKYDGKSTTTIPSDDSDILSLVRRFFLNSRTSNYNDFSSKTLKQCDVAYYTDPSGTSTQAWTPLVVCVYECVPS